MSVCFPTDCLAYHLTRPLLRSANLEHVNCSVVAGLMDEFSSASPMASPETSALMFYQLSHAMVVIQQRRHPLEPLPAEELALVEAYFKTGSEIAQRAFYYLIMICQRETRHLHDKTVWKDKITAEFGAAAYAYIKSIPDQPSTSMSKFIKVPPKTTLGPYLKALAYAFYNGGWSHGYGGKKWGVVTDCAIGLVTGKYSPAIMLDTVWTLCHNGGPIFNKGVLFTHHSGNKLIQILDVQRAGMLPALIRAPSTPWGSMDGYVTDDMKAVNEVIFKLDPSTPTDLDYQKIQDLGAVLSWSGHAKKKTNKNAPFPGHAPVPYTPKTHPPHVDTWTAYSGVSFNKLEIKRAA